MTYASDNVHRLEAMDDRDLHAYVDGFLDEQRARQFEEYLKRHPEIKAKVDDYKRQNRILREAFESNGKEPVPPRLLSVLQRPVKSLWPDLSKIAAVFVLCVLSAGGGWWGAQQSADMANRGGGLVDRFLQQVALNSAQPFEVESVSRLEINSDTPVDPINWLTQKVALEMQAPNLASEGYSIQWRRLVTRGSQEFVELTYSNAAGDTIKLYLKTRWEKDAPTLEFVRKEDQSIAYWQDGPLVYALSGSFNRERASKIADLVRTSMSQPVSEPAPNESLKIKSPQTVPSVQPSETIPSLVPGLQEEPLPLGAGQS